MSRQLSIAFTNRDCATSLGKFFQCLTTCTVKRKDLYWDGFSCFSDSCPVIWYHWGSYSGSVFFIHSHQVFPHVNKIPPEPLCFGLDSPFSQPLLVCQMLCLLYIFLALQWTCSSESVSFLHLRAQNWTHHSQCGPTSGKHRGRITSLNLLATNFHMQSVMLLPSFPKRLVVNLSNTFPRFFSADLLSSWTVLVCTGAWGYSSPDVGPAISICWGNLMSFLSDNFSSLLRSLWMTA